MLFSTSGQLGFLFTTPLLGALFGPGWSQLGYSTMTHPIRHRPEETTFDDREPERSLYTLGDRGETVDGLAKDVRGRQVKDKNGDDIGKVADLLIDDREHTVRFLLVEHGGFLGFGATESVIPVDAITEITEDDVSMDQSGEHIAAAPGYTPDLVDDRLSVQHLQPLRVGAVLGRGIHVPRRSCLPPHPGSVGADARGPPNVNARSWPRDG